MSLLHHANRSPHTLGHVRVEPELEVQADYAKAKAPTNLALDQAKPWCI
jgi:hypothetical protein